MDLNCHAVYYYMKFDKYKVLYYLDIKRFSKPRTQIFGGHDPVIIPYMVIN